jgi:hypothetical protein
MVQGNNRRAQLGNAVYTLVPVTVALKAIKTGSFSIGPVTASVVIEVPSTNRRRDPFDPLDFFGGGAAQKQVAVATEPTTVQCLPLPTESVPPSFGGAVGNFTMAATAGPTTVTAGDPITLRVQISGKGNLDAISLPEHPEWRDFKTYPPSTKLDTTDPLGLEGSRTFEQVLAPQGPEVKQLPEIKFSFFNPDLRKYVTLTQPALPLTVRPASSLPSPTVVASARNQEAPPPTRDIVHIKPRAGALAQMGSPLVARPWFLAFQGIPLLTLLGAYFWRRHEENLANNPRLRRQRRVAELVREDLARLRRFAADNKAEDFFASLFHLLQEQLGERLDMPASAITEAVIEEQLRPKGVAEPLLTSLHELFQACNVARYAPVRTSQELAAYVPKVETVLKELQSLRL